MTRRKRTLFIVLCVIVGLIVVASVAVRLVFTRDRLMTLVVPRIEKRIGAKIGIGDIGIRFPFGFGVDIRDLTFEKPLPDGSELHFSSGTVTVRASLLSLLRRKPEINSIAVENANVKLLGTPKGIDIIAGGLKASLSVKPDDSGFSISERVEIDALSLTNTGDGTTLPVGKFTVRGDIQAGPDFNSLKINKMDVLWADMLSARISGEVTDVKTARNFSITVSSDDVALVPLLKWIETEPVGAFAPALRGTPLQRELPVELTGGTVGIESSASGSAQEPAGIDASGTITLNDISLEHELLRSELRVAGNLGFSKRGATADNVTATFGRSKVTIGFNVETSADRKPERIAFESDVDMDLGDLQLDFEEKGMSATGKITARIKGEGTPATLNGLFPSAEKELSPERIKNSWERFALEGQIAVNEMNVSSKETPFTVSSLSAEADIVRGDIRDLKTDFMLNGSLFSCNGSLQGFFPAFAELAGVIEKAKRGEVSPSLGEALDRAHNAPSIALELKGRAFDARPLQESAKAKKQKEAATAEQKRTGAVVGSGEVSPLYNPVSALFMKSTSFSVQIDSVITEKAIFTGVYTKGDIKDGRMHAAPFLLNYANGKGNGSIRADFRNPPDVKMNIVLSFRDIEAGRALGSFSKLGTFVDGTFTFKTNADFVSGPGVNPLITMNATGSAFSSNGKVDISSLLAPLKGTAPLDLSPLERFSFREWTSNFRVSNGRLMTDDWKITSSKSNWFISGSYGFDGTLDYAIKLVIPPDVQKEMKDLKKYGDLVNLLRDTDGNLVIDLNLGGTAKSPKLSLDMTQAEKKAGDKLIDDFMKKAKDWLKK